VTLHERKIDSLLRSAERLGFRHDHLAHVAKSRNAIDPVLLTGPSGERLAVERNAEGRVVLRGSDQSHVQRLVRGHTADRVVEHLRARGAQVQTATLANGEIQLVAVEPDHGRADGRARLRAQVRSDGGFVVEVSNVRGARCTSIVESIASAADCAVVSSDVKDDMFNLPGEPTVVRERI
jgi:hypothetical protein